MSNERRKFISELQNLAEKVLRLKSEHRQKRPIVIEFSGSPKAGKTSCINSLELFLKRNGFSVKIIQERASVCPVNDKQSPMFNIWTVCMSLSGLIGVLEDKSCNVDVLILDRGIFDALCWFDWLVSCEKMEDKQRETIEAFLFNEDIIHCIDIIFAFCVKPEVSIEREYATLLTDKLGSIMNTKVLGEYLKSIENIYNTKRNNFHKVFKIDTSNKNQDEVGKEVTETTLNALAEMLMERIGYFDKIDSLMKIINSKQLISHNEINNVIPHLNFDLRDAVENNSDYIQPIPIAVITNMQKNKILVIKKNKASASDNSPEKGKLLLYVGGHSRSEDIIKINSEDFLSVCKTTLKREIKEEIGISVALNNLSPNYIYTPTSEKSKNHLAVCFLITLDDESIKLHLDSHELVMNKGKSKSGKFLFINEIISLESELEEWDKTILDFYFNEKLDNQLYFD